MTPGSFAWLVRHELRLAVRGTGRRGWFARTAPLLLLVAVPVVGGIGLAVALGTPANDRQGGFGSDVPLGLIGAGVVALFLLMMSTAAIGVLRTFHDRGDLDLLLAAPIPAARVLAAKTIGVAVSVAAPFTVIIAPFALTRVVLGQPGWIGVVAMVGVDAMLATALAIVVVGGLVTALGPRPARVAVQLGAAVVGGGVFLATQAPSFAPAFAHRVFAVATRPWPAPLDWPARAVVGELLPLAAMVGLAIAATALAAQRGARAFVASGDTGRGGATAQTTTVRFHAGLTRAIVVKELRLIARDPELITQIALRLVYLIPAAALLARGQHGAGAAGPAVAAAVTAFATLLASSLAWIVVAAEDAPDLLAAAPRTAAVIAHAKLIAATSIPLALVAVAAVALTPTSPAAAAATIGVGAVAAVTAALLQAWFGKPAPRSAFRRRAQASFVIGVGELILAAAWAATANLLALGSGWAVAPALIAAMIVAGAIEARKTAA
jgi:ABC-2 type transport system permease protein